MKMWKGTRVLAVLVTMLMLVSAASVVAFATGPSLTLDSIDFELGTSGADDVAIFTVGYSATDVEQVTILAVLGDETEAQAPDSGSILYIDQDAPTAGEFVFKVKLSKFDAETDGYIYIKIGGTAIDAAVEGDAVNVLESEGYTVSGYVQTVAAETTIQIKLGSEPIGTKVVTKGSEQTEGEFVFENVAPGTYTLVISAQSAITRTIENVVVVDDNKLVTSGSANAIPLLFGRISGNEGVGYTDMYDLKESYGRKTGDADYNENADFYSKGFVNYMDMYLLKEAYGKSAANAYGLWIMPTP